MNEKQVKKLLDEIWKECGTDLPRLRKKLGRLIKQGRETGDFYLIGSSYYYLAAANWRSGGERDAVLLNAIKATAMLEQTKSYRMIARGCNMLGIAYLGQENYQMALESYNRTYRIAREHRSCSIHDRLITLNNIADCYYEMGDYKSSRKVFERCLEEACVKTPDNLGNIALYCINLAASCEKLGEYEKALEVLDRALDWIDGLEMKMCTCLYFGRRAGVLFALGRIAEGSEFADRALAIIDKDVDTYEFHKEFEELAHALIDCGDLERAMKFGRILSDYSEMTGHTIDRLMTGRVMAHYYRRVGNKNGAIKTYEELNALYEKRITETKAMQLTALKKIKEANREIVKLKRTVKASRESASRDFLTGLLNRAALLDTASGFISAAMKKNEKVGAVFIDIDLFKECNDTYGRARGDEIIKLVAEACREHENASVRFARYGGDEFLGIMHGLSNEEAAKTALAIADRIRFAAIPNEKNPNGQIVTLSMGLANVGVSSAANAAAYVVDCADKALYRAKESGRNAIFLYDPDRRDEDGNAAPYVKTERPEDAR